MFAGRVQCHRHDSCNRKVMLHKRESNRHDLCERRALEYGFTYSNIIIICRRRNHRQIAESSADFCVSTGAGNFPSHPRIKLGAEEIPFHGRTFNYFTIDAGEKEFVIFRSRQAESDSKKNPNPRRRFFRISYGRREGKYDFPLNSDSMVDDDRKSGGEGCS